MKFFRYITLFCVVLHSNTDSAPLSTLAQATDKGPSGHNYTEIYEKYFNELQHKPLKFLEIGFLIGGSARMWDAYFSQAQLHFIDVSEELFQKYGYGLSNRCHLHIADQSNADDLLQFIEKVGGEFDIIIDDGGHKMHQQITSFKTLFPFVKSGGLYIIEDLHTSYWQPFGGMGTIGAPNAEGQTTIRFLQSLVDDVSYIGAFTGYADVGKCPGELYEKLTYYQKHIQSIHFYGSVCFILKR